jgi:hypothetical protein
MTMTKPDTSKFTTRAVIDCDIHPNFKDKKQILPYLASEWHDYYNSVAGQGHHGAYYPRANMNAAREDSWPPVGGPPASDLPFLREQLLDEWDIEIGVLQPLLGVGGQLNLEYAAAMARAQNDWLIDQWMKPEPRLRSALVVPYEDADLAVKEIERIGHHPGFVQVMLMSRTSEPLGRRKYWKLFGAAAAYNLPIGVHFGGNGGGPITGAGWPSFYVEDHAGMSTALQQQLISMVCEGVFERIPNLKLILVEGGFAWIPPLAWRLDAAYKDLKIEVPFLKRLPSEYIKEHVWLTTQPMEEPDDPKHFVEMLEMFDLHERLMFATDYPHWDFDAPDYALPKIKLPAGAVEKIMSENARSLYGLGRRAA